MRPPSTRGSSASIVEDGSFCDRFGARGQIDLIAGLRRKPEWAGEYGVTSPPAVSRDLVIVGSSVADNSRARMASGEVRAFDRRSGCAPLDISSSAARTSAAGGANTWSRITVDDANGLVFLPTSSPSPDYFGGLRPGDNRQANAVVALRPATGAVVWSFQTVHHDLWDYDVASPPLALPGKDGAAVAVGSKTGHLFLFERLTGRPIFPIRERPVPASDVTGESAAATQPFPDRPAPLVPQQISEADIWGATPQDRDACLATFRALRHEGAFTPPSVRGSLLGSREYRRAPLGRDGVGSDHADDHRAGESPPCDRPPAYPARTSNARGKRTPVWRSQSKAATPFAMSRQFFLAPSGIPCVAPPWGELVAIHADTGETVWRTTLGDLRATFGLTSMPPTGALNLGGPVVTTHGSRLHRRDDRSVSAGIRHTRAVVRCGKPNYPRARGPRLSCSPPQAAAR